MTQEYLNSRTVRSGDVLDTICRIMDDDGPQPMRNMKPTQKVRNGAEQFSSEHHGEYEARGRQSSDRVGKVNRHNETYPKMRDELKKRRSCMEVTVYGAKRSKMTQVVNTKQRKACVKKLSKFQNRNTKSVYRSCNSRKKTKTRGKNRISKSKRRSNRARPRNRVHTASTITENNDCQISNCQLYKHKMSGNDNSNMELSAATTDNKSRCEMFGTDNTQNPMRLKSSSQLSKGGDISNGSEAVSLNPDTSDPSITTYNSNTSIVQITHKTLCV
ncbi:uncharacterized protein LOC131840819 [Achroia grisella]|uniref:uncharacterized protein LOC131840819 n=1 Tax=Achroia grisella TaxID=688607 RepID=UPI0027D26838|nr:uncharacterized protein LOC131840819 [Achroia grisella]